MVLLPAAVIGGAGFAVWHLESLHHRDHTARLLGDAALAVAIAAAVLGALLAQAAGMHAGMSALVAARPDRRASVRAAVDVGGAVLSTALLVGVFSALAFLVFVVPGIYLWFAWFVVMPVVVFERRRGFEAINRSRALVRGRWWQIFGAYVVVEIFVLLCTLPIGIVVDGAFHGSILGQQLVTFVLQLVLTPVQVALTVVVYVHLRMSLEGVTTAEMAREAGIVPGPGPHGPFPAAEPPWPPVHSADAPGIAAGGQPDASTGAPGRPVYAPPVEGSAVDISRYTVPAPAEPQEEPAAPREPVDRIPAPPAKPWPAVSPKPTAPRATRPPKAPGPSRPESTPPEGTGGGEPAAGAPEPDRPEPDED